MTRFRNTSVAVYVLFLTVAAAIAQDATKQGDKQSKTVQALSAAVVDDLHSAIQSCWNTGSLSTDALSATVTLALSLSEDGKPDSSTIRLLTSSGGDETSTQQAFEAARRAIIVCGVKGFDLPPNQYELWKDLHLVFSPDGMAIE